MYRHALVTGGAGFVGSYLALSIKRKDPNTQVTALDNLHRRGSELNLGRLKTEGVVFVHADVRSLGDLVAISPQPDLIVECSAEPSAQAGYGGSPEYLIATNLLGCFNCLELARRTKADFIFLSTSRVYPYRMLNGLQFTEQETRFALTAAQELAGASECGISERFPLEGARSLYGMTKLASELMVEDYADAYGFRFVIDRSGLITGPRQMGKIDQGIIALWMAAHYFRKPLRYIGFGGTGKQVRDFIHVDDICDLALEQIQNLDSYNGQVFNVGGGLAGSLSLLETTRLCEEITGNRIDITSDTKTRPADVRIYVTDSRKLASVRGWKPKRDARATLTSIFNWIRDEEDEIQSVLRQQMS
ncbi:MAG: 3-beta hydroxysteroid dehydrogenase [Acidobacteria bacterium]|nr:MAG: 3-beta hydroxysteroid dehydrogenase [Acidobacteriota bacterium]